MANRIKARTEWLDSCANEFRAIESALQTAQDTLSGITLNKAEGGELRVSLNLGLRLTGTRYSGSTAQADVQALSRAAQALAARVDRLGSAANAAARAFEDAENTAIRLMRGTQGGTEAEVYEDAPSAEQIGFFTPVNVITTLFIVDSVKNLLDKWGIDILGPSEVDVDAAQDELMREQMNEIFKDKNYKESKWNKASLDEKKRMLNEIKRELNRIYNTNITADIVYYNEAPTNGYITNGFYNPDTNLVNMNTYSMEHYSYEHVMTTLVHEMRHAYQDAVVTNPENYHASGETVQSWSDNINNYLDSDTYGYDAYRAQPIEQDARDYSESLDYTPSWWKTLFH